MTSNINYKFTLFKQANLTTICDETPLKTLHKLWNEIKANDNSIYSNLGGGSHSHIGIVLTNV